MNIDIFDIDGTITHSKDLWVESSLFSSKNKEKLISLIESLKKDKSIYNSKKIMKETIKDIDYSLFKSFNYDFNSIIRKEAIATMKNSIADKIILSTTNYEEVGILFKNFLEKKYNILNLEVQGTQIDWEKREINYFNIAYNKSKRIKEKYPLANFINAYGDDPYVNDKGILELAENSFVIKKENFNYLDW